MNLAQLRDRVYAHLRDDEHEFHATDVVEAWLNDAGREVAARTKVIRREADESNTAIDEGDGTFALPEDFLSAISLRFGLDDAEFVDDDVFWSWSDGEGMPGHTLVRVFNGRIETYPMIEDGASYRLRYVAAPATMSDDADVPELPSEWHSRLTYYALAQAWMQKDEGAQADRWLARFEDGLPPLPMGRERFSPGPLSLTFEPGPFDRADSRHW